MCIQNRNSRSWWDKWRQKVLISVPRPYFQTRMANLKFWNRIVRKILWVWTPWKPYQPFESNEELPTCRYVLWPSGIKRCVMLSFTARFWFMSERWLMIDLCHGSGQNDVNTRLLKLSCSNWMKARYQRAWTSKCEGVSKTGGCKHTTSGHVQHSCTWDHRELTAS